MVNKYSYVVFSVIFFCLWVNVFCLTLLVGHSSPVPPKRKKGIKRNETAQPAGTVHEMQEEISGLVVKPYPILRTLTLYEEILNFQQLRNIVCSL